MPKNSNCTMLFWIISLSRNITLVTPAFPSITGSRKKKDSPGYHLSPGLPINCPHTLTASNGIKHEKLHSVLPSIIWKTSIEAVLKNSYWQKTSLSANSAHSIVYLDQGHAVQVQGQFRGWPKFSQNLRNLVGTRSTSMPVNFHLKSFLSGSPPKEIWF